MWFRSVALGSAICTVLLGSCSNETRPPSESLGVVAQRAVGDTDLTLRASTTTPAGGTPTVLSVDAPVTTSTDVVQLTLEGNWNNNILRIASPPTVPDGWSLDYYAGGIKLPIQPATPAAWQLVTRVVTSGAFQAEGSLSGNQISLSHASSPQPQVASSFSGGSAGDGWDVFFDPGYTKVYNIHHHSGPATVMCRDLVTSATCPGFPIALSQTSSRATGFIDGPTKKLWQPTVVRFSSADDSIPPPPPQFGWDCVDLTTSLRCTVPTVLSALSPINSSYDGISDPVVIGRKIYTLSSTPTNVTISCFDMSTATECTAITTALGGMSWWLDGTTAIGSRLYFKVGGTLDCYDTATSARCAGSWPQAVTSTRPVRGIPNADETVTNVCADYQCFALDGTTTTLPTEFLTYADTNRTGGFFGSYYSNSNFSRTRVVWATGSRKLTCFDMATKAPCSNAFPFAVNSLYTAKVDPLNSNCVWTNGDDGIIRNWDVPSGNQGCTSPPPIFSFQTSVAVARLACDPNNRVGTWKTFTLTNPLATDYTSATFSIKDSGGTLVPGFVNVPMPANSIVDLSTLTTTATGQTPTFEVSAVGLTNTTTPTADFKIEGQAPQLCWTLTPPSTCPASSSVVAKGSVTPAGGALSSYTDQSLAISSGTAGTIGCGVIVAPANPALAPRAMQAFTATGGSGVYTWSLATSGSAGTIDVVTGVYTAGPNANTLDVVRATDTFGTVGTSTVTVGPGVTVAPVNPSVLAAEALALVPSGGSGVGYTFVLTTSPSGGSITPLGVYTGGLTTGVADTVTVTDSLGNATTVSIAVVEPLVIVPSAVSLAPRAMQLFSATGGAGTKIWSVTTNRSGASIDANGSYQAGSTPSVTDVVTVTDTKGRTSSANVAVGVGVSITPANPAAPPGGSVTLTAAGGSGTGYVFTLSVNHSNGTVTTGGIYTAGRTDAVVDTVTVNDSLGNTAAVNVAVGNAITIAPPSTTAAPLGSVTFVATGGSGVGYVWSFRINASQGTIASGGVYQAGTTGNVTDTIQVTDSLGNVATANVVITAGLLIGPSSPSVVPLGTIAFTSSGGALAGYTWQITKNLSGGTIDAATGAYQAGLQGGVADTVQLQDSLGNTYSVNVSVGGGIAVNPAAPTVAPKGPVTFTAIGGTGGPYTFRISTNNSGGSIVANRYVAGAVGSVIDVVEASDALGNQASVDVHVGAGLTIAGGSRTVPPHGKVTFSVAGGSGTGLTWDFVTNLSGGTVMAGTYQAGGGANSTDFVRVTDSLGNTATVEIQVGPGITISPSAPTVMVGGTQTFTAQGGQGSGYSWTILTNGSGGSIDATTGAYVAGALGGTVDVIGVTDPLANAAQATVTVPSAGADAGASDASVISDAARDAPPPSVITEDASTTSGSNILGGGCNCAIQPRSSSRPWATGALVALFGIIQARRRRTAKHSRSAFRSS